MTEKHCLFASLLRFTTICTAPPCICFSFLLYFFPSSFSLSLCLRRVLRARRTFSSLLWWYWLQSLPWLQPWSIDQPALLEANKHAWNLHKVCVWVITRCQAPRRNAPQGECKSPELLLSIAYWLQWQPVGNGCLLFFLLPSYFCNNFTIFKRTAFWESHQESSIKTENIILITHLIQLTGSSQWVWSNSSHSALMH